MAKITSSRQLDMVDTEIWYGQVTEYDASKIVIEAGSRSAIYRGDFSYDNYGNVFGRLYSYENRDGNSLVDNVTDINRDAYTFMNLVNSGNTENLYRYALSGKDYISASGDGDRLVGYSGADKIFGRSGNDWIDGGDGNDLLDGGAGRDILFGDTGNDTLRGGGGADKFFGGAGKDVMFAGVDNAKDVFVFNSIKEAGGGKARDIIRNFDNGLDDIDLRKIDADTTDYGNQNFSFSKSAAAHTIWYVDTGKDILVRGDVSGDGKADFEIQLAGVNSVSASDFIF